MDPIQAPVNGKPTHDHDKPVSIPVIPAPLHWRGVPQDWALDDALTITAGPRTDWFIDPAGTATVSNAPALLFNVQDPCMLKARVTVNYAATFDAGGPTVFQADDVWAKLC